MTTFGAARSTAGAFSLLFLAGCATPPVPLYVWGDFPRQQYQSLLREGSSPLEQIGAMNAIAERVRTGKGVLPPGFRAHLGMLHLRVGNADSARELWLAEKAAFPESRHYMDSLLKKLDGGAQSPAKENPV